MFGLRTIVGFALPAVDFRIHTDVEVVGTPEYAG